MKHLTCVQNFLSLNAWSSTPYSQCSPYPHSWIRCVLAEKGNFERVSTLQLVKTTSRVSRGLFTLPLYFILRNFLTVRLTCSNNPNKHQWTGCPWGNCLCRLCVSMETQFRIWNLVPAQLQQSTLMMAHLRLWCGTGEFTVVAMLKMGQRTVVTVLNNLST